MTWEWSHTDEAYLNAYHNLLELEPRLLLEIYAEIRTYQHLIELEDDDGEPLYNPWSEPFDQEVYKDIHLELCKREFLPLDAIANDIWQFASEQRNCTNGGWRAHLCPYGCGCHMVSFDRDEDADCSCGMCD